MKKRGGMDRKEPGPGESIRSCVCLGIASRGIESKGKRRNMKVCLQTFNEFPF